MSWESLFGYYTGLWFVAPGLGGMSLVGTVLVVHICDAIVCRVFAHNGGHPKNKWTVLGFLLGIWAVIFLVLRPHRPARP